MYPFDNGPLGEFFRTISQQPGGGGRSPNRLTLGVDNRDGIRAVFQEPAQAVLILPHRLLQFPVQSHIPGDAEPVERSPGGIVQDGKPVRQPPVATVFMAKAILDTPGGESARSGLVQQGFHLGSIRGMNIDQGQLAAGSDHFVGGVTGDGFDGRVDKVIPVGLHIAAVN